MAIYSALYGTARYGESYYGVIVEDINSNLTILKSANSKTINSDMYIKKIDNEETISSDMYILKGSIEGSINSNMYILKITQQSINSLLDIKKLAIEKNIISRLFIKKINNTQIIKSDMYISKDSIIKHSFRPQINDEVIENGICYRIISIHPVFIGRSEIGLECDLTKVGEE